MFFCPSSSDSMKEGANKDADKFHIKPINNAFVHLEQSLRAMERS